MSLLVVGTLAFDSVETPFGRRDDVLGGSASFTCTAASYLGRPVYMAGVVGEDFPPAHMAFFKSRGIDVSGVQALPGKTFRWTGRYDANLSVAHTLETQLNVLEAFRPELPPALRSAQYVFLGNFDPDLQLRVLDQVEAPKLIACDTMDYWINGHNARLRKTLRRVHVLSINEGEARLLSGEYNLLKAAQAIFAMGPRVLVIKRGEYGALLCTQEGVFAAPGLLLEVVRDPTGAGDTFAGGLMGHLARAKSAEASALRQAVVMGNVMASFAVEEFSLDRLRNLSDADIRARVAQFQSLVRFEIGGIDG